MFDSMRALLHQQIIVQRSEAVYHGMVREVRVTESKLRFLVGLLEILFQKAPTLSAPGTALSEMVALTPRRIPAGCFYGPLSGEECYHFV